MRAQRKAPGAGIPRANGAAWASNAQGNATPSPRNSNLICDRQALRLPATLVKRCPAREWLTGQAVQPMKDPRIVTAALALCPSWLAHFAAVSPAIRRCMQLPEGRRVPDTRQASAAERLAESQDH